MYILNVLNPASNMHCIYMRDEGYILCEIRLPSFLHFVTYWRKYWLMLSKPIRETIYQAEPDQPWFLNTWEHKDIIWEIQNISEWCRDILKKGYWLINGASLWSFLWFFYLKIFTTARILKRNLWVGTKRLMSIFTYRMWNTRGNFYNFCSMYRVLYFTGPTPKSSKYKIMLEYLKWSRQKS